MFEAINTNLNYIKVFIEKLYRSAVTQILRQRHKLLASYYEISNLKKSVLEYGDDFWDLSKVASEEGLVYDKDGYALGFKSKQVLFNSEYYQKSMYPVVMSGGRPVAGTDFKRIFTDDEGFWSYQSDEVTPFEFMLSFENEELVNKIYIRTHNKVTLTLYVRNVDSLEFEEVGDRNGVHHVWNFWPRKVSEIKVTGVSDLICVNYVDACLAKYNTSGTFVSEAFSIENLYKLSLEKDIETPPGTQLDLYAKISGKRYLLDEPIVTGGINWIVPSATIELEEDYILDSLLVRSGYQKFDSFETEDWAWETENLLVAGKTGLVDFATITYDYKVIEDGVKRIYIKNSNIKFEEGSDYAAEYDVSADEVRINRVGDRIPLYALCTIDTDPEVVDAARPLYCEIMIRRKVVVRQKRIYIDLEEDKDIYIDSQVGGTDYCLIRHLNLKNIINNEKLVRVTNDMIEAGVDYIFHGLKGLNLIEFEYYTSDDVLKIGFPHTPVLKDVDDVNILSELTAFAYRYPLRRVSPVAVIGDLEQGTYYIEKNTPPTKDKVKVNLDTDLLIEYAVGGSSTSVILEIDFAGNQGWISSTLRSYELKNRIIPGG